MFWTLFTNTAGMYPKVWFNSIKREQRYHEFKLDVHTQRNRPGPRGDPTRGGSPKNVYVGCFFVRAKCTFITFNNF